MSSPALATDAATTPEDFGRVEVTEQSSERVRLVFRGRFDADSTPDAWKVALGAVTEQQPAQVIVDGSEITYIDGSGIAVLVALRRAQTNRDATFTVEGLSQGRQDLLKLFPEECFEDKLGPKPSDKLVIEIGKSVESGLKDLAGFVSFLGRLFAELVATVTRPGNFRWRDFFYTIESAGLNAVPIICLLGFLIGLILAFQSAIPLRYFGALIYIADIVSISLFRELGPLITSIVFAGRSVSAFAAELGTMKVREEINALRTMGLSPVRFLVQTRVIASMLVVPMLTVFTNFTGLIGAAIVMRAFGFSYSTYIVQVTTAVTIGDFVGGLFKAAVFGFIIAAIGCEEGINTGDGASAVGDSTTSSVVRSIIMIIVLDGIFSILFYIMDW